MNYHDRNGARESYIAIAGDTGNGPTGAFVKTLTERFQICHTEFSWPASVCVCGDRITR